MGCAALVFSPERGQFFSAGWDTDVRAWDVATLTGKRVLRGIGEVSHAEDPRRNPRIYIPFDDGLDSPILAL
eukprot:CAMPEP_0180333040 /NCGR_PEP_ID=MMETSP0988-20121125/42865_1 /TAXON_ID=697907 /ORGANISM="non described non described, Strain CCMP2293" /LENGTH=71 /DNA_ID=CAMNT_0022320749 /DNA_START=30 /DNA_END=241 /DNA_ORIENTATION=-